MESNPEILQERTIHRRWLNVVERVVRHPNGACQTYEIVNPDSHSVSVVAFDEHGDVVLVEMYRFAQHRRLFELPAGAPKAGESLIDAAARELLEETGYAGALEAVGSHYIAAEHGVTRHGFIARSCVRESDPAPDASEIDERMRVVTVPVEQFVGIVRSGRMTEVAAAYMALDRLGLLGRG